MPSKPFSRGLRNYRLQTNGEERAGCFALFVFLVSRDCCVALPRGAIVLSAVCDCDVTHGRYITWTGNTNRFTDNRYSIFAALKSR